MTQRNVGYLVYSPARSLGDKAEYYLENGRAVTRKKAMIMKKRAEKAYEGTRKFYVASITIKI